MMLTKMMLINSFYKNCDDKDNQRRPYCWLWISFTFSSSPLLLLRRLQLEQLQQRLLRGLRRALLPSAPCLSLQEPAGPQLPSALHAGLALHHGPLAPRPLAPLAAPLPPCGSLVPVDAEGEDHAEHHCGRRGGASLAYMSIINMLLTYIFHTYKPVFQLSNCPFIKFNQRNKRYMLIKCHWPLMNKHVLSSITISDTRSLSFTRRKDANKFYTRNKKWAKLRQSFL